MNAVTVTPSQTGLSALGVEQLPLLVACAIMIVAAFINYWTLNVPNWLSFSGLFTALVFALLLSIQFITITEGGVDSVLVSMIVGGLILIPLYVIGGLGAGCVKMQAAYGAWLGCAYPIGKAATLTAVTTVAGALLTLAVGLVVLAVRRLRKTDPEAMTLLPAQVTLSLGSLVCLAVWLQQMG